jgi:uncharacterized damage-inducible protein DinB
MTPPKPEEYAPMMGNYINLVSGAANIITLLEEQNAEVFDLFNNLTEDKAMYAYGSDKWTLKQVIGHIIDAERTFAYRAYAFARGQAELPGFDENAYVERSAANIRSVQDLAAEFKAVREANLYFIRALNAEQQTTIGISNGIPTTVRALVYTMAGHAKHHVNIVRERYF